MLPCTICDTFTVSTYVACSVVKSQWIIQGVWCLDLPLNCSSSSSSISLTFHTRNMYMYYNSLSFLHSYLEMSCVTCLSTLNILRSLIQPGLIPTNQGTLPYINYIIAVYIIFTVIVLMIIIRSNACVGQILVSTWILELVHDAVLVDILQW